MGVVPPRPRPVARLPVERGRPRPACATAPAGCASALALWNGADPILKERIFGLTGPEGNHGEDAKEYWWYLDATPTHSWMRWRYHYPQRRVPVRRARRRERPARSRRARVRAARHRDLRRRPVLGRSPSTTPRPAPTDLCRAGDRPQRRAGDGDARTCCRRCGSATRGRGSSGAARARRSAVDDGRSSAEHADLGPAHAGGRPRPTRCCSATTRRTPPRCGAWRRSGVPQGRHQRPRRATARRPSTPPGTGTKAAVWHHVLHLAPGRDGRGRAAAHGGPTDAGDLGAGFDGDVVDRASARPTSSTPS